MKKLLLIMLIVPFFFACEKEDDDEIINVTVQNPDSETETKTQEEFRIDDVTVISAGSTWIDRTYLYLRVVDETNNFSFFDLITIDDGLPTSIKQFQPSNRSEWRIFAYHRGDANINVSPGFSIVVKPWDYKNSDSTFSIPASNGNGTNAISFTISGTVVNVPVN